MFKFWTFISEPNSFAHKKNAAFDQSPSTIIFLSACSEIGEFKSKNNIETEDKSREKKIFEKIDQTDLKYRDNIKEVEAKILLESKKIQDNLKWNTDY